MPDAPPAGDWPARAARAQGARAGRLRAAVAGARHRRRDCARARPGRHLADRASRRGGCCGALSLSPDAHDEAIARSSSATSTPGGRTSSATVEAIVVTASGCGVMVKDYGHLLRDDPAYAEKAERIAELARDPVEIVAAEWPHDRAADRDGPGRAEGRVPSAVHAAARHEDQGARRGDPAARCGLEVLPVADAHLCCGSAGTYSMLQPALSQRAQGEQAEGAGGAVGPTSSRRRTSAA